MNSLKDILIKKKTLFSVLGILFLTIGIPGGIYGLTLKGGASLGGALILIGVLITFIILLIDRALVNKVSPAKLSQYELIFFLLFIGIYSYTEQKIIIDLSSAKTDYFVLIENNGNFKGTKVKYSFPFNKKIIPENNNAIINSISESFPQLNFKSPDTWHITKAQPWNIDVYTVRFYSNGKIEFSNKEIDSLIIKEIKSVTRIR